MNNDGDLVDGSVSTYRAAEERSEGMEFDSTAFLIVIVLLAAVLASIAAWAPRKTLVRVNALLITLLIMPIGFLQVTEMLSRPKPANYEWLRRHVDKVTVLSASFREKQATYL